MGLWNPKTRRMSLGLVPLFETIDSLRVAPAVMKELYLNRHYWQCLQMRGGMQQIMIGYSESNKNGGFLASRWEPYKGQKALAEVCALYGVTLKLFHGRGGSISRGGGPTNQAILAQHPSTANGRIRITEQGEVIPSNYHHPEVGVRHLEQVVNALIVSKHLAGLRAEEHTEWLSSTKEAADLALDKYRSFVYGGKAFRTYFREATPIEEIVKMNVGSRPVSRTQGLEIEDVRAIPWVFSWTQNRHLLPSWYELGTGFRGIAGKGGIALLRSMYSEWPFFKTLVSDAQMPVAKADIRITDLYSRLVEAGARRECYPDISEEYGET